MHDISCILFNVSCVLYPVSCILCSVSFIYSIYVFISIYVLCIVQYTYRIEVSCFQYPVSSTPHQCKFKYACYTEAQLALLVGGWAKYYFVMVWEGCRGGYPPFFEKFFNMKVRF